MHTRRKNKRVKCWKFLTCVFYGGYRVGWAKNQLFVETNNDRAAFILARPSRTSFSFYFRGEVSYKLSVFCGIRSCRVQSPIRFNVYLRNLWISCSMFPLLERRICEFGFFRDFEGKIRLTNGCECRWVENISCINRGSKISWNTNAFGTRMIN